MAADKYARLFLTPPVQLGAVLEAWAELLGEELRAAGPVRSAT